MPWLLRVTLTIATLMVVLDLYLLWRWISAFRTISYQYNKLFSGLIIIIILLFWLFPLALLGGYLTGYTTIYFDYPPWMVYTFWYGLALTLQVVGWILIADVLKIIVGKLAGFGGTLVDSGHAIITITITLLVAVLTGYRMYQDSTNILVDQYKWNSNVVPAGLDGFKIVHITDVQADSFTDKEKLQRYVDKINAQHPDMVVFTGDLVTEGTKYIGLGARMMGKIKATHGIYGVIGDHDYWAGAGQVHDSLEAHGMTMLNATDKWVSNGSDSLLISGVTNVYSKKADPGEVEKITAASDGAPLKVFISHQISPMLVRKAQQYQYNLFLAGHTHGGQLVFSILGYHVCAPMMETKYISGRYHAGNLLININNGLGYTLAPVRLHAPANISVLTLHRP